MHTQSVEDYLTAIYKIQSEQGKVATTVLARRLGVTPASVTGMIKHLADMHLVTYEPYQGFVLTDAGQQIALEVIRRHRLIELHLQEALGYSWDEVHAEAEQLEHVISEAFEDRIAEMLGHPEFDPHGEPIPAKDGSYAEPAGTRLTDLAAGQSGRVARVSDDDPALLRYLAELGITLDATLTVIEKAPFDGPLHVRVGTQRDSPVHALGKQATDQVFVEVK